MERKFEGRLGYCEDDRGVGGKFGGIASGAGGGVQWYQNQRNKISTSRDASRMCEFSELLLNSQSYKGILLTNIFDDIGRDE